MRNEATFLSYASKKLMWNRNSWWGSERNPPGADGAKIRHSLPELLWTSLLPGSDGINLSVPPVVIIVDISAMVNADHEIVKHLIHQTKTGD